MANNKFKIYDSNAVDVIICDIPVVEGRVKEGFCKISADAEMWGTVQDCNGVVTRFRTNNRLYTVEVSIHQSSVHNAQFSALFAADYLATDGSGVGAALIKDNNGASLVTFTEIWIKKSPEASYAEGVETYVWTFQGVGDPTTVVFGGN